MHIRRTLEHTVPNTILSEELFATRQVKDTSIHWLRIYHLAARLLIFE